jgi:hypothetical protein
MLNIQATKDTFYKHLRDRIAVGNPARTILVRGSIRPGVIVIENEIAGTSVDGIGPAETFCLRWLAVAVDTQAAGPLINLACEIRYASDGTAAAAGIDRGRSISAMDAELATALMGTPMNTPALAFTEVAGGGSTTAVPLDFNIFWSGAEYLPLVTRGGRMERTAHVEVFGYGQ